MDLVVLFNKTDGTRKKFNLDLEFSLFFSADWQEIFVANSHRQEGIDKRISFKILFNADELEVGFLAENLSEPTDPERDFRLKFPQNHLTSRRDFRLKIFRNTISSREIFVGNSPRTN